jgi:hypothetical protein
VAAHTTAAHATGRTPRQLKRRPQETPTPTRPPTSPTPTAASCTPATAPCRATTPRPSPPWSR